MLELGVSAGIVVIIVATVGVLLWLRKRRTAQDTERLRLAVAEGQLVPLSLHPAIDPTLCVGSFSCIKACPEGEIIGIVDGVASLVEAAHCIGHGTCAVECPVGAIKLVFGTAERGIDLPQTEPSFESSRNGVFIIGELGGMGLIKNALRQGLVLGKTLQQKLKQSQARGASTDVVIVGGGPAGIACAVACRNAGLHVRVLEQDTLGGTIAHYPRGKVVMTEQIMMPGYGPFGRALMSKEELVAELERLVRDNDVTLEEGQRVVGITGQEPQLTVTTASGLTVRGRAVVLAIGLRGTPQRLGVPGEDLSHVMYRLVDPEQYHGKKVVVVGGGDSAVEAAIQLAEESTATVNIVHRQAAFTKCKQRNRDKLARLIDEGRVRAHLQKRIIAIENGKVRIAPAESAPQQKAKPAPPAPAPSAPPSKRAEHAVAGAAPPTAFGDADDLGGPTLARPSPFLPEPDPAATVASVSPFELAPPMPASAPLWARDFLAEATIDEAGTGERAAAAAPAGELAEPESEELTVVRPQVASASAAANPDDAYESTEPLPELMLNATRAQRAAKRATTISGSHRAVTLKEQPQPQPQPQQQQQQQQQQQARQAQQAPEQPSIIVDAALSVDAMGDALLADLKKKTDTEIRSDAVIVSIGGTLPSEFLRGVGVRTRVYRGEEKTGMGARPGARGPTKAQVEARWRRRLAMGLTCLGAAIIVGLTLVGQEYYWIPVPERADSALHALMKPSGLWGHGVGVAATFFMFGNFLYVLRKRWRPLKGTASIRTWLTLHMFIGIMGPLVIAFHAAFLLNNLLAVYTWIALAVVVGTGIFGRFLFTLVPAQAGKLLGVAELREQISDMTRTLQPHMAEASDLGSVTRIFVMATEAPVERTVMRAVMRDSTHRKSLDRQIDEARALFKEQAQFELYRESLHKIGRMKMQIALHTALKRIFRGWLIVHIVVSVFMVLLIGAHVGVTTYVGFRWIFT